MLNHLKQEIDLRVANRRAPAVPPDLATPQGRRLAFLEEQWAELRKALGEETGPALRSLELSLAAHEAGVSTLTDRSTDELSSIASAIDHLLKVLPPEKDDDE